MAVEKVEEEEGKEGGKEDPSVLLPLLHTFALLASPEYDPAEVMEILTGKVMRYLSSLPPSSLRCLVETLALSGHSYVPSSEVLVAVAQHAATRLLSATGDAPAPPAAAAADDAADDADGSSVMVDYVSILRGLATIVGRKSAEGLGLGSAVGEEKNELEEEWREEKGEEGRGGGGGSAMEGIVRKVQEFLRYF